MHFRDEEAMVIKVDLVTHQLAKGYKMLLESGKMASQGCSQLLGGSPSQQGCLHCTSSLRTGKHSFVEG